MKHPKDVDPSAQVRSPSDRTMSRAMRLAETATTPAEVEAASRAMRRAFPEIAAAYEAPSELEELEEVEARAAGLCRAPWAELAAGAARRCTTHDGGVFELGRLVCDRAPAPEGWSTADEMPMPLLPLPMLEVSSAPRCSDWFPRSAGRVLTFAGVEAPPLELEAPRPVGGRVGGQLLTNTTHPSSDWYELGRRWSASSPEERARIAALEGVHERTRLARSAAWRDGGAIFFLAVHDGGAWRVAKFRPLVALEPGRMGRAPVGYSIVEGYGPYDNEARPAAVAEGLNRRVGLTPDVGPIGTWTRLARAIGKAALS